jgi:hypothetical protein
VVVGIVGVLSAMSMGGLEYMNKRASFTVAAGEILGSLRKTQAEATGRGDYTAFIVDTRPSPVGGNYWGIETNGSFDVSTFNPAAPGNVIVSGSLPYLSSFGPAAGFGATLPKPYDSTPVTGSIPFCSFCLSNGFGAILFQPGGIATFNNATPPPVGLGTYQQFTVTGTYGGGRRTILMAIVGKTGDVETFEQ